MTITVLGNSLRFDILCDKLISAGYSVTRCTHTDEIPEVLEDDVIILPIPSKAKDGFLNLSGEKKITIETLIERTRSDALIITCNYLDTRRKIIDINKDEYFAFLNAVPTAEGAISIALKSKGLTMYNSKCLIVGFGRIGKILAHRLDGLKADISVAARNPKDLALIKALGLKDIKTTDLDKASLNYDVIFQTVPALVLNENLLKSLNKDCLIVELSSASAGTDLEKAKELSINVISAGGLPEKTAPITAGMILFESVIRIITDTNN